jgi:hypothetical protein
MPRSASPISSVASVPAGAGSHPLSMRSRRSGFRGGNWGMSGRAPLRGVTPISRVRSNSFHPIPTDRAPTAAPRPGGISQSAPSAQHPRAAELSSRAQPAPTLLQSRNSGYLLANEPRREGYRFGLGPPVTPYCSLPAKRKPRGDAGDGRAFRCRRPRVTGLWVAEVLDVVPVELRSSASRRAPFPVVLRDRIRVAAVVLEKVGHIAVDPVRDVRLSPYELTAAATT